MAFYYRLGICHQVLTLNDRWESCPAFIKNKAAPMTGNRNIHLNHGLKIKYQASEAGNKLKQLIEQIVNCKRCRLWKRAKNAVPGEGPKNAKIMLVGQNPGEEEDRTGKPFVGRSGRFLDKILNRNNIQRKSIFITSVVKHKTPNNRKPRTDEIKTCLPYLLKQIENIKPKIIVLMGKVAWQTPRKSGIKYIEIYHPAAAMRFPKFRDKFEADFRCLKKLLEKTN
jgi:uracil-DNA glycosylase